MIIQDMVAQVALDFQPYGGFHLDWVRVAVWRRYGVALSFKQTRDALYRLTHGVWVNFLSRLPRPGRQLYYFGSMAHMRVCRRTPVRLAHSFKGGIYYRRLTSPWLWGVNIRL